ncbi:unnamed protein product [Cyprideis torosa]|uniref:Uncharacterized protein n=2 Tax=Cyprideis torosa TaxID=163714 RepID=A0A7R8WMX0_9CRUS|nr:unnamed protein product [Cyprideis torosa]CAG0899749.1 unnamed protein product [Cyprideis torosa]
MKKQGMLPLTFADPKDYDKVQPGDIVTLKGITGLKEGSQVTCVLKHEDGSTDSFLLNHTMNDLQIGWFKAGSALNRMKELQALDSMTVLRGSIPTEENRRIDLQATIRENRLMDLDITFQGNHMQKRALHYDRPLYNATILRGSIPTEENRRIDLQATIRENRLIDLDIIFQGNPTEQRAQGEAKARGDAKAQDNTKALDKATALDDKTVLRSSIPSEEDRRIDLQTAIRENRLMDLDVALQGNPTVQKRGLHDARTPLDNTRALDSARTLDSVRALHGAKSLDDVVVLRGSIPTEENRRIDLQAIIRENRLIDLNVTFQAGNQA